MRQPTAPSAGRPGDERVPTVVAAAAVLASAAALLALQAELTFRLDDWAFLLYRRFGGVDAVLNPHNEHIVLAPVLLYKALLAAFGAESARPFQLVATLVFLTGAALLFVYMRRRVGGWLALAGLLPVLFLGNSAEDLLWQFQVGFLGSIAAGIGALLALERDDRGGDALAAGLLVVAVSFSSLWLPFAAAAAVIVGSDRRRWRRAYVVAVPVAVYGLWWLGWGQDADSAFSPDRLPKLPAYVAEGFASSVASWTGIGQASDDLTVDNTLVGGAALILALAGAGWRLRSGGRPGPWLVAACVAALSFWIAAGANATLPGRSADASRYQLLGVVFGLMIAAEALRGVKPSARMIVVAIALALAATASNLASLIRMADGFEAGTRIERADLAALELARGSVTPDFELSEDVAGTSLTAGVRAELYFPFVDQYGSPAIPASALPTAPDSARSAADRVLALALSLGVESDPERRAGAGPPPELIDSAGTEAVARGACLALTPGGADTMIVRLPAGGVLIRASGGTIDRIGLRRFATRGFPIDAGALAAGMTARIAIPPDSGPRRWELGLRSGSALRVCGLR